KELSLVPYFGFYYLLGLINFVARYPFHVFQVCEIGLWLSHLLFSCQPDPFSSKMILTAIYGSLDSDVVQCNTCVSQYIVSLSIHYASERNCSLFLYLQLRLISVFDLF